MSGPIPITDTLWLVPGEGRGRFPRSNAVLVRDREAVLVDTGCGLERLRALRAEVRVDRVLNTHTHPDHAAGNFLFADRPILVPEPGAASAGDLEALSIRFFDRPALRPRWRAFIREQMGFEDQHPKGAFAVDAELAVGETRLQVIHAPGHTVDHCCLFEPEARVLVSADIALTGFGPWYGHPESDLPALRRSIARVKALAPRIVLSAHRPPLTEDKDDIQGALDRFAAVIDERNERILALLERERTLSQLVEAAPIYGRFPYAPELMRYWEEVMLRKHLEELVERSLVEARGAAFRRT